MSYFIFGLLIGFMGGSYVTHKYYDEINDLIDEVKFKFKR